MIGFRKENGYIRTSSRYQVVEWNWCNIDLPSLKTIILNQQSLFYVGHVIISGDINPNLEFRYASNALRNVLFLHRGNYTQFSRIIQEQSAFNVLFNYIFPVCYR